MGYQTPYDKKREDLRDKMDECMDLARELATGHDILGFEEMPEDYGMKVYMAVKEARNKI